MLNCLSQEMNSDQQIHINRWKSTHLGYANSFASSNIPLHRFHLDIVRYIEDYETAESDAESAPKQTVNQGV